MLYSILGASCIGWEGLKWVGVDHALTPGVRMQPLIVLAALDILKLARSISDQKSRPASNI